MINAERPWNTASVKLEETSVYYCCYCKAEVEEYTEIDHGDSYTYRNCKCVGAKLQHEIDSYKPPAKPLMDTVFIRSITYRNELRRLNKAYGK